MLPVPASIALCLADLHSSATALHRLDAFLRARAGWIDIVLAAGDITVPGHEAYAGDFIELIRRYGKPLLLVHGNNDGPAAVEHFRRAGVTIHRRVRELGGYRFAGFGGDGTAPHDLELGPGERLELDLGGALLLTHVPPARRLRYGPDSAAVPDRGQAEDLPSGVVPPLGGGWPRAHVCGHIHHMEGVAWLGPTKVIKLGAAMWNRCALLDLSTLQATFLPLDPQARPAEGLRSQRR